MRPDRTVVAFELLGDRVIFKLAEAPIDVPGLGENEYLDASPLPAGDTAARGAALRQRLETHPPVKAELDRLLGSPPGSPPAWIYFHTMAATADELPWEQLYAAPHGFCGLDRRWPLGRIARVRRGLAETTFEAPLRIVAVLSAAGRSGMPQLAALLEATAGGDAQAVGVHLHVITGEDAAYDAVMAAGRPDVSGERIGASTPDLVRQIAEAEPNLLHLLGHGGLVAGVPNLSFATISDFDGDAGAGSVPLMLPQILDCFARSSPWLVVLNACDTAEVADGRALAHELACAGIPAVVGMRRIIDLADANRFCASLYPEVLAAVRAAVDPASPPEVRTINWAATLTTPRMALTGADPAAVDTWSDPVLYVQADPFQTIAPSAGFSATEYAELRGEIDVLEGYLDSVDQPDPRVRAHLEARIEALRARLAGATG